MLYTLDSLTKKLKRSVSFVRLCIDKFRIKRTRLKNGKTAYDIELYKWNLIKEYSESRIRRRKCEYKPRNKKTD